MVNNLEIISNSLLSNYIDKIDFDPVKNLGLKYNESIPFDYFDFYTSVSSVYSSKIEGEDVEVDSYMKHKFLNVSYEADYTKRADDLFAAYEFAESKELNLENVLEVHSILSQNLLSPNHRGIIRTNPMFVINEAERIEYVACDPFEVKEELDKLFTDIKNIKEADLSLTEIFYYASYIHLVFIKIHPLQDGNGRTARLIEKWFLREKIGKQATSIELEKNYYKKRRDYYKNIRKLGLEYANLNYQNGLDFLLMTINSLK